MLSQLGDDRIPSSGLDYHWRSDYRILALNADLHASFKLEFGQFADALSARSTTTIPIVPFVAFSLSPSCSSSAANIDGLGDPGFSSVAHSTLKSYSPFNPVLS